MNCFPLQLPEQLSPLNKHQFLFIFIPPAFDLHLVTYFTVQELTRGSVFTTIRASTLPGSGYFWAANPCLGTNRAKKKIISMCHIKEKRWKSGKHPDIAVSQLNIAL